MKRAVPLLAVLLAGCTVGPNYKAPEMQVPPSFGQPSTATPGGAQVDLGQWWHAFGDAELDHLVAVALAESPDLQSAASKLRQARLGEVAARAQYLPQVNADANAQHVHFSKNAGFSSLASLFSGSGGGSGAGGGSGGSGSNSGGIALPGGGITTYSLGFDASWELDLFGGGRRGVEGARARTLAAEWQARDAQVSLVAEVADSYLQLRTLQSREAVLNQQIASQNRALELMNHTAQVGLVPQGDYIRQRAGLAATQAQLEPLRAQQAILIHALAVLVGRAPEAMLAELSTPAALPAAPPAVPPGLPSDLLRRRPDIRAAERNLAAATADIGVATADLYPHFSLTGTLQLISSALGNLFSTDSIQHTESGRGLFPILDWGKRKAQVKVREEDRQQAYLDYQKAVLAGLKDVDDALVRIQTEQSRNATLRAGVADAQRAMQAADARYKSGLSDLSAVLQAQQSMLQQQDQLAASDGQLRQDLASLYKALGGGWSQTSTDENGNVARISDNGAAHAP